jgi:NTP pyrophosphatase (non-canonical NTP hydrolase)
MDLEDFQSTMREIYLTRNEQRGVDGTFRWLTEELGELARAIRTPP